uniref:Uncharacterized protein n=1 Tax=Arundo donax TaxID=35708 RepID=A0A0A9F567_ARUDO
MRCKGTNWSFLLLIVLLLRSFGTRLSVLFDVQVS